jgi:hypothetical protein
MLVNAAVAATVGLASAISGGAVALHLAAGPPPGEYLPQPRSAATAAAIPSVPTEKSMMVVGAPPSAAQARTAGPAEIVLAPSVTNPALSVPDPASPPLAEHKLTFAWGYAQRHPVAAVRRAEARFAATVASAGTHGAAPDAKSDSRRPAERQRASVAQRETVGLASSGFFAGFGGDRHQALGYTEERGANGLGVLSRAQFSAQRATTTSLNVRNHDKPRS